MPDNLEQPQSPILENRRKTVDLIFNRAGVTVSVYRTIDTGSSDGYGKGEEAEVLVADNVLAVLDIDSGVSRREDRYGERVEWEPGVYFKSSSPVLEKDIIEYPMARYPENPNAEKQRWEVEKLIPFETHVEGCLQRFIEQ